MGVWVVGEWWWVVGGGWCGGVVGGGCGWLMVIVTKMLVGGEVDMVSAFTPPCRSCPMGQDRERLGRPATFSCSQGTYHCGVGHGI